MKNHTLALMVILVLGVFVFTSCDQSKIANEEQDKSLLEKENELLKKENELLKKEQELNQKNTSTEIEDQNKKDNIDYSKEFKDKYPNELLENPIIEKRLKKLLGSRYSFFEEILAVQSPVEIDNGYLYGWGMQAHSGGDPGAVIMADINKDILYVGIRENGKDKLYSEDGSDVPKRLKDWDDEQ